MASSGGAQLTLAAPCNWLRILSRRTGAKNFEANPLRKVTYKGVTLEAMAAAGYKHDMILIAPARATIMSQAARMRRLNAIICQFNAIFLSVLLNARQI